MFMPDLVRNFLYGHTKCHSWLLECVLRLVSSELHCCAHFSRGFFWTSESRRLGE
jgi:hypothetical protein